MFSYFLSLSPVKSIHCILLKTARGCVNLGCGGGGGGMPMSNRTRSCQLRSYLFVLSFSYSADKPRISVFIFSLDEEIL